MSKLPIATVYQGDTARLSFEAQDSTGAPEDLTGCAIRWALSATDDIGTPVLTKASDEGITVLDAEAGRLVVTITAGELDTPGTYTQELEITLPSGATYTYGQGPLIVKPTALPTVPE